LAETENYEDAARYYRQALPLCRKIGQPVLSIVNLAGLARVTMAWGNVQQALAQIGEVLAWLKLSDGYLDELTQIYWICYQTLNLAGAENTQIANQAEDVLKAMYTTLREQAARIDDKKLRRSYLEKVEIHQKIIATWEPMIGWLLPA
jgi:hypothetical protein